MVSLIHSDPTDNCISHSSSRKLLFGTDGDHCKIVSTNINLYIITPVSKVQGEQKDCKSQRNMKFGIMLYLLVMSEATPIDSCQDDCLYLSQTRTTTGILMWTGKSPGGLDKLKK